MARLVRTCKPSRYPLRFRLAAYQTHDTSIGTAPCHKNWYCRILARHIGVMSVPVIICPNCHFEIKLTESFAAPLIEAGRKRYENRFAEKGAAAGGQLAKIAKQRQSIEAQVTARLDAEHQRIAGDESERQGGRLTPTYARRISSSPSLDRLCGSMTKNWLRPKRPKLTSSARRRLTTPNGKPHSPLKSRFRSSLLAARETARREAEVAEGA